MYDELVAREATVITVGSELRRSDGSLGPFGPFTSNNDFHIQLPSSGHTEVLATIMLQLISYYLSIEKGINPDYPRNIAKVLSTD